MTMLTSLPMLLMMPAPTLPELLLTLTSLLLPTPLPPEMLLHLRLLEGSSSEVPSCREIDSGDGPPTSPPLSGDGARMSEVAPSTPPPPPQDTVADASHAGGRTGTRTVPSLIKLVIIRAALPASTWARRALPDLPVVALPALNPRFSNGRELLRE